MASFRDLKNSRAARHAKSYASQSDHVYLSNPITAPTEPFKADVNKKRVGERSDDGPATMEVDSVNTERQESISTKPVANPNAALKGWYADLPSNLAVKRSKKRGRGLWTREGVKAGTILFSLHPHFHVLSTKQLDSYCSNCCLHQSQGNLNKCTNCRVVSYCSTSCQKADWEIHRLECDALDKWAESAPASSSKSSKGEGSRPIPNEAVRCLARILWKRTLEGSDNIWWKEIDDMQSNRESSATPTVDSYFHLSHALVRYLGIDGPEGLNEFQIRGIGELVDLISKFSCNSFTLTSPSLSPIGVALSPITALINHSCDPNVAVVFPRPDREKVSEAITEPILQVVAIQDIPANAELFTTYVDITQPASERIQSLKETYGFTCECKHCSPKTSKGGDGSISVPWQDPREALSCPKNCGGICPLPLTVDSTSKCNGCDASITDIERIIDIVRVGEETIGEVSSLQSTGAIAILKRVIPLLTHANFAPSSHPLLALQRLYQAHLVSTLNLPSSDMQYTAVAGHSFTQEQKDAQARLDGAIRASYAVVLGLKDVLRTGHPVRALAVAELGKLLAADEPAPTFGGESDSSLNNGLVVSGAGRLRLALETLRQAHAELLIAFGTSTGGGEVGKDIREMVVMLEKEMGIWTSGIGNVVRDAIEAKKRVNS